MANTPVNEPDIKLLFGVEGGASIDQGSGKQIFDDLKRIVSNINGKDVLKIKVGLDDGAAKEFKEQIKGIMSGSDAGVEVKIKGLDQTATDAGKAAKALDDVASSAKKAGQAAKESSGEALAKGTKEYNDALTKVNNMLIQLRNNSRKWTAASGGKGFVDLSRIEGQITLLEGLEKKLESGELSAEDFAEELSRIRAVATDAAESINKLGENHAAVEILTKDTKEYNDALTKSYALLGQIYTNQNSWTKAATGASAGEYASLGANASDLSDLIEMLKTGRLDAQTFAEVFSNIKANVTEAGTAIKAAGENMKAVVSPETTARLAQVNAELKEIAVQNGALTAQYRKITAQDSIDGVDASMVDALKGKYQEMIRQTELLKLNRKTATDEDIAGVRQLQAEVQRLTAEINRQAEAARSASATDKKSVEDKKATLKEVINLYNQIDKYIKKNSRAEGTADFDRLREICAELGEELDGVDTSSIKAEHGLSKITKVNINATAGEVRLLQQRLHEAGKDGMTFAEVLTAAYEKFGGWMLITQSLTKAIGGLKKMVENVAQLDAAMTELKKVTNETDAAYNRFLNNASVRARQLGASLADVVDATASFARLGHSIDVASKLADAALVYKNVGDGITDITQASESIVSTMQAFQIDPDNVMHIVDVFNSIGNKFAISSGGVGEALQRSSAAMYSAGNTLEETSALIAAANTVLQNPDSVGTTLKTVSMFLRASKVELEEAGESTEGMANSVSELQEKLLTLTEGRVNILTEAGNYKSTYQILKEIAEVWDHIVETQGTDSAAILELLGGKRNANAVAAILENFDIAEEALSVAMSSTGSALKENEIYLDSIAGKTAKFQAAWQTLSATVVNSGLVKGFVDFGTVLLDAANGLTEFLGPAGAAEIAIISLGAAIKKFTPIKSMRSIVDGFTTVGNSIAGGAK